MSGRIELAQADLFVREQDGDAIILIRRTGDLSAVVTVGWELNSPNPGSGTATRGLDYTGTRGSVTFAASPGTGTQTQEIRIPIINDTLSESTETFALSLVTLSGGALGFPRNTNIFIRDDENPATDPVEPPLTSPFTVTTQTLVSGLNQPLRVEFSPFDPTLAYVVEKGGRVRMVDIDGGGTIVSTVLDISSVTNSNSDRGLMDIALHPNLTSGSPYLYAFYVVDPAGVNGRTGDGGPDGSGNRYAYVSRFTLNAADGYRTIVPGSEVVILGNTGASIADINGGGALNFTDPQFTIGQYPSSERFNTAGQTVVGGLKQNFIAIDSTSHAGGALEFGPRGELFVSIGDGTSFNYADPRTWDVLDVDSLKGKILRIDPITGAGYSDNPFAAGPSLTENRDKVFQLGVRNPFAMAVTDDGQVISTNTGWFSWEQLNFGGAGANFGWPYYEGGDNGQLLRAPGYTGQPQQTPGPVAVTPAFRAFSHNAADPGFQFQAIVGGNVIYDGGRYPAVFTNDYFFTNIVTGELFSVDVTDRRQLQYVADLGLVDYSQGPDGYVYYADLGSGTIGRLLISGGTGNEGPLNPNGTAFYQEAPNEYVLTSAASQGGAAFSRQRIDLRQNFTIEFSMYLGAVDAGGDGIAFVLQDSPQGSEALGLAGQGLGANGIARGFGVEFDTFNNNAGRDIAADHMNFFDTDGAFFTTPLALPNLETGAWRGVSVSWVAATRTMTVTTAGQTITTGPNFDLTGGFLGGNFAYFGWTGATGDAANTQEIRVTRINATYEAAPSPAPTRNIPIPDLPATEDTAFSYSFPANSFFDRNDALSYSATRANGAALPSWLDFNPATRTFSGTPTNADVGVLNVRVTATDTGGSSASDDFLITVANVNDAPALANPIADQTALATAPFVFTLPVGVFGDIDAGDLLTPSARLANGAALPAWLSFNPSTGVFSGTPGAANAGVLNVRVTATDRAGATASDDFTLTIRPPGATPTLALVGSATFELASEEYTLTPSANGQTGAAWSPGRIDLRQNFELRFDVNLGVNDAGADGLAFVLQNDSRGVAALGDQGGGLGATGIVNGLAIEFDTWDNGAGTGDIASDHTNFFDTDGAFRTTALGVGAVQGGLNNLEDGLWRTVVVSWNAATQTLSYTIDGAAAGSLQRNVVADFFGGSNFVRFGFTAATGGANNLQEARITGFTGTLEGQTTNAPPAAGADTTMAVRGTPVVINVLANDSDPNADPLQVVSAVSQSGRVVTINANNTLTYLPDATAPATERITYTISDGRGATASAVATVTVFTPPPQQTALPGSFLARGAGSYEAATGEFTLTPDLTARTGAAMSQLRLDVRQGFELRFEVFLGARDSGGDGVAFVLHNDARGSAALGAGAGSLGAVGIVNGLGVELDTRDNGAAVGDIAADHTNFLDTDNGARVGAAPVALPNLEDGAWHTLTVRWTPTTAGQTTGTLTYQIDGLTRGTLTADLAATYLSGSALAHFGLTGATNSVSNLQEVRVVSLNGTFDGTAAMGGGPGADRFVGSAVVNTFDGGRGNDRFTGGGSTDIFVFTPGWGADSITDFADTGAAQDVIDLRALGLGAFANVPAPVQVGADTVLTFGGANAGNTITLVNFIAANLGADDFLI